MDSMRSLNTSLPLPQSRRSQAPELLQAFRSAALSVTNLYKRAAAEQTNTGHLGYQEALGDLLSFLDRENLGLQDGEGWKIRQWATERFEGHDTLHNSTDSDEDRVDTEKRARSSSAISPPRNSHDGLEMRDHPVSDTAVSEREPAAAQDQKDKNHTQAIDQPPSTFTFCASQSMPTHDIAIRIPDTPSENLEASSRPPIDVSTAQATGPASVRVGVLNRNARLQNRHVNGRHGNRSTNRDLSFAGGTKRKFHFPEFFDISSSGNSRENSSAGKRGRYV
jgi:hypothetical protein